MKKLIALAMAMMLAAVCLSACSSKTMTTVDATEAPVITAAPTATAEPAATEEAMPQATAGAAATEDAEVTLP